MRYGLVIFDFDGTLADSFPWFLRVVNDAAARYRFRRVGEDETESLRGWEARRIIEHLGIPGWKLPLVARYMRARMTAEVGEVRLFDGVGEMLRALAARGMRLAIVSSNSVGNARAVLGAENAALIGHFGCGASVFGKRPKLRQVLRASGIPPARALCIGDEIRDFHAAHAEGIAFGAVGWGYTRPESLAALRPAEQFASVAEIAARLTAD